MSNTPIELKGSSFTLSVVHLHDANPEVIRQALEDKIAQAPAFLRHAPVVVNIASIEEEVDHIFLLGGDKKYRCAYCEQEFHPGPSR